MGRVTHLSTISEVSGMLACQTGDHGFVRQIWITDLYSVVDPAYWVPGMVTSKNKGPFPVLRYLGHRVVVCASICVCT